MRTNLGTVAAPWLLPRFRSIFVQRIWMIAEDSLAEGARFPVGLLLREGGWLLISCRPPEVPTAIAMASAWGCVFGTLAFRRHMPTRRNWKQKHAHILSEDIQEVIVICFKPPYSGKGLARFQTKGQRLLGNYPTRWEYTQYWKMSVLWGYPRLEIWARPRQGNFDPRKWTRIGPKMDGMPIEQSLWLEHSKRFAEPLDMKTVR